MESGWGSMVPTAVIAHMAKNGPAARTSRLNIGDQITCVNGLSLVGLSLDRCTEIVKVCCGSGVVDCSAYLLPEAGV